MNQSERIAVGTALLRISLGILFLAHSVILKYGVYTLAGTAGYFASLGLPEALAYAVFAAEAVGGALLLLGVRTREVAAALLPILVGATWVHAGNGWVFSSAGGGWEFPLFLLVVTAAQVLLGPGAWAWEGRHKAPVNGSLMQGA